MTDLPDCRTAQQHLWQDRHGDWWETFEIPEHIAGQSVRLDNEIIRPGAATQTPAGDVLASHNLCAYPSTSTTDPVLVASVPAVATPKPGDGSIGLLLVLGLAGSAVWAWFNKGKDDAADTYHPMADVPQLPPVYAEVVTEPQGNQTHGIPTVEPLEFAGNSLEFARNSHSDTEEFPRNSAVSDWPPKTMGAPYDPLQPEQAGEFDTYRHALETDGLPPRGNDVIKVMWGVTPGRSQAYQAARKRRDEFAKRLDYYRYEEL